MPYLVLLALGAGLAAVVVRRRGHFDTHLPPAFEAAVVGALRSEKNPGRLRGFGEALLPDYPIAGCVLLTRARNIMTTGAAVMVPRWNWALHVQRPGDADAAQTVVGALASDPRLLRLRPDSARAPLGHSSRSGGWCAQRRASGRARHRRRSLRSYENSSVRQPLRSPSRRSTSA